MVDMVNQRDEKSSNSIRKEKNLAPQKLDSQKFLQQRMILIFWLISLK